MLELTITQWFTLYSIIQSTLQLLDWLVWPAANDKFLTMWHTSRVLVEQFQKWLPGVCLVGSRDVTVIFLSFYIHIFKCTSYVFVTTSIGLHSKLNVCIYRYIFACARIRALQFLCSRLHVSCCCISFALIHYLFFLSVQWRSHLIRLHAQCSKL